ncbi:hypothetical protein HWV62_41256 [Athelia sp. TMB]|nr:hypothetical protein HWV62_41256 [Athelia sp. TMB]
MSAQAGPSRPRQALVQNGLSREEDDLSALAARLSELELEQLEERQRANREEGVPMSDAQLALSLFAEEARAFQTFTRDRAIALALDATTDDDIPTWQAVPPLPVVAHAIPADNTDHGPRTPAAAANPTATTGGQRVTWNRELDCIRYNLATTIDRILGPSGQTYYTSPDKTASAAWIPFAVRRFEHPAVTIMISLASKIFSMLLSATNHYSLQDAVAQKYHSLMSGRILQPPMPLFSWKSKQNWRPRTGYIAQTLRAVASLAHATLDSLPGFYIVQAALQTHAPAVKAKWNGALDMNANPTRLTNSSWILAAPLAGHVAPAWDERRLVAAAEERVNHRFGHAPAVRPNQAAPPAQRPVNMVRHRHEAPAPAPVVAPPARRPIVNMPTVALHQTAHPEPRTNASSVNRRFQAPLPALPPTPLGRQTVTATIVASPNPSSHTRTAQVTTTAPLRLANRGGRDVAAVPGPSRISARDETVERAAAAALRVRRIREAMEELRVNHDCTHSKWKYRRGGGTCQTCSQHLPKYLFVSA